MRRLILPSSSFDLVGGNAGFQGERDSGCFVQPKLDDPIVLDCDREARFDPAFSPGKALFRACSAQRLVSARAKGRSRPTLLARVQVLVLKSCNSLRSRPCSRRSE